MLRYSLVKRAIFVRKISTCLAGVKGGLDGHSVGERGIRIKWKFWKPGLRWSLEILCSK